MRSNGGTCGMEEFNHWALPRQRHDGRRARMDAGEDVTTVYTPINDTDELMRWTLPDGSGHEYRQRWVGGLATAPDIGAGYRVTHDEWIQEDDGAYLHIIHAWVPADEA